jgi:hypothetical protein
VSGVSAPSIERVTSRQRNLSDAFRMRTPGRSPASQRIWNPLQMPTTGPPAFAKAATSSITGEKRASAPQRR